MKLIACCLLIAVLSPGLTGCALFNFRKSDQEEEAKETPPEGPKLIGRIASIPPERKFVLIQSYGKWNVETGSILTTRGPEERTANLLATGESLGEFAAADIQSGQIEVGDAVYSRHIPKSSTLLITPESPENQTTTEVENVQKNN